MISSSTSSTRSDVPSGGCSKLRVAGAALLTCVLGATVVFPGVAGSLGVASAQAAAASARQIGTVKTISGSTVTLTTDAGQLITVTVADSARILQLAPGSTNLASAQAIALTDIALGDRLLVTGKSGVTADGSADPAAFTASRVILMKATDLAQKHAAEEADWQKRGTGGLVSAVDPANGTITIAVRGKKLAVQTASTTIFRRYASDSVKFEAATTGTLSQIQPGDQLRVRGARSEDGSSLQAEEIVSGSFKNLAGTIASINSAAGTLTLKDLTTKKTYTVAVTANSSLRALPAEAAARFAARARTEQGGAKPAAGTASSPAAPPAAASGVGNGQGERHTGSTATDLSQMLGHLPDGSLKDLHAGDAVMVVASQPQPGNDALTAVTLLSGVEAILAATPSGSPAMALAPWSVGNAPEGPVQ